LSSGEAGTKAALPVDVFDFAAVTERSFRFRRPGTTSVELNASMKPLLSKISGATQHKYNIGVNNECIMMFINNIRN